MGSTPIQDVSIFSYFRTRWNLFKLATESVLQKFSKLAVESVCIDSC